MCGLSIGQDTSCDTCRITTNQELRDHVDSWIADPSNHPCGEVIGDWEVGRVTDMSYVFCASTWFLNATQFEVISMLIFRNGTRRV